MPRLETWRSGRRISAIIAELSCVAIMSACSSVSAGGPTQASPKASRPASHAISCSLQRGNFLSPSEVPGFTQFVSFPREALPVRSAVGHPLWFERGYVCGSFYGFITNMALSGAYKRENDSRFRRLGYPIGRFPYVPLTGSIVFQQPHHVLEIYEGIYQFNATAAADGFFQFGANDYLTGRLHPDSVPRDAVVSEQILGPDPQVDEHQIYVQVLIGRFVVTASIQGGRSLSWTDARPYWQAVARAAQLK